MIARKNWLNAVVFTFASFFASQSFAQMQWDCTTDVKVFSDFQYRTSAWVDGDFDADSACRAWEHGVQTAPWLYLDIANQTAGGWDATVGRNNSTGKKLDSLSPGKTVGYTANVGLAPQSGDWWFGAKVAVTQVKTWPPTKTNLVGDYECYIIENSTIPANDFWLHFSHLSYESWSWHNESAYLHYTGDLQTNEGVIHQILSVRQIQRSAGQIPVGAIMKKWRQRGYVPNWYGQGWLAFLETQGQNDGIFLYSNLNLPDNN